MASLYSVLQGGKTLSIKAGSSADSRRFFRFQAFLSPQGFEWTDSPRFSFSSSARERTHGRQSITSGSGSSNGHGTRFVGKPVKSIGIFPVNVFFIYFKLWFLNTISENRCYLDDFCSISFFLFFKITSYKTRLLLLKV